jgi:hypothetical protein
MNEDEDIMEELGLAVVPLIDEFSQVQFTKREELRTWLIEQISYLIDRNFEHMLRVLYLIDVNEGRVRKLIQENDGEDAAGIIADLILERQAEKIRSRKKYVPKNGKYFSED